MKSLLSNTLILLLLFSVAFAACDKDDEGPLQEEIEEPEEQAPLDLSRDQLFSKVDSMAFPNEPILFEATNGLELVLEPTLFSFNDNRSASCFGQSYPSTHHSILYENDSLDVTFSVRMSNSILENPFTEQCRVSYRVSLWLFAAPGAREMIFSYPHFLDPSQGLDSIPDDASILVTSAQADLGYTFDEVLNLNGTDYPEVYLLERLASGPHSMIAWSPRVGIVAFADRTGTRWFRKL